MDFLEEQASKQVLGKVTQISGLFCDLADAFVTLSERANNMVRAEAFLTVSDTIRTHVGYLFQGMPMPWEASMGQCYDLLFLANEYSVPFVIELDTLIKKHGVVIGLVDEKSGEPVTVEEALRVIITQ